MTETLNAAEILGQPFSLRCGITLKNRIIKAATSEIMATKDNAPTPALANLYGVFADGGVGVSITGNVMVDQRALGEPRNVVVENKQNLAALRSWATAGCRNRGQIWMQINHPGKQSPAFLSPETVAPSAVPFASNLNRLFPVPRALSDSEIFDLITRFATTAGIAKQAGFPGVQIHAAHGYLVNQFLSPLHNIREDRWGGSLDNRMRFLIEIYRAVRGSVGTEFPISIKINSADFQKGGFSETESMQVLKTIAEEGIDLIEISGGTYESPSMMDVSVRESTRKREAFFLDFARQMRARISTPLMVTGGFRSAQGMAEAVASGSVDLIGTARAIIIDPNFPNKIIFGSAIDYDAMLRRISTGISTLDTVAMLPTSWYENQLARIGSGKSPKPSMSAWGSVIRSLFRFGIHGLQQRRRAHTFK